MLLGQSGGGVPPIGCDAARQLRATGPGIRVRARQVALPRRLRDLGPVRRLAWMLGMLLAAAGATPAAAQRLTFHQFSQEAGLSNLGMHCLDQDHSGFLLVCTEDGAFRYDGRRFEPLGGDQGLPGQGVVYDIELSGSGRMFVVFSNAVFVSRMGDGPAPGRGRFIAARPADGPIEVASPHRAALLGEDLLLLDRDQLAIVRAPSGGPPTIRPYFDAAQLAAHPELRHLVSVGVGADGIWLGCGDGQLCHVAAAGAVTVLGAEAGLPRRVWSAILSDRSGTLWLRSLDRIVHRPAGAARFAVDALPGSPGRYAGHADRLMFAEAPDGRILTEGRGGLLAWKDGVWSSLDISQGVPEGSIVAILFDREGSLWLGVRDQGIFRGIGVGAWENWSKLDGLKDNVVWQMARTGTGPLWVATEGGVDALPATVPRGRAEPYAEGSSYSVATTSNGQVWQATVDGVLGRYDPATGRHLEVARLPPTSLLFVGRDGRLWIGTDHGLYLIADPQAAQPAMPVLVPGFSAKIRDETAGPDGSIWVLEAGRLLHLTGTGSVRTVMASSTGLSPETRKLAFALDGTLWIGSMISGIQRLHLGGDRVLSFDRITVPVIGSNNVLILCRDRRGWMWVGTDRGLDVWNGLAWQHVDEQDGLLSDDIDEASIFDDPDGSMWFGTGHGISHLLDPGTVFTASPLHPVITSALLGGRPLSRTIPWSHDPLVVRFSALDYRDATSVRFRYRLAGVDQDWVDTGGNEVRYPQLPAGKLVFSVMAYDPLKRRASVPVSFQVRISPPWWRTCWFSICCAVAAAASIASLWRMGVRYLLLRQRQLEALVTLRTAEIERARAILFEQATHDNLTGLLNRPAIMDAFDDAIDASICQRLPLTVALIDLDHFKSINDSYGHLGGDEVLREVSRRLTASLRPNERAGRYGGEELVLLLPGERRPTERIRALRDAMLAQPVQVDACRVVVTCSIGVAFHERGDTCESLLRRADTLLYSAKHGGRDRIVVSGSCSRSGTG